MIHLLKRLNIEFDKDGNTNISKEKLLRLVKMVRSDRLINEHDSIPDEFYLLIDRNQIDFYPFPHSEYSVWERDGSFEKGDAIYDVKLLKKIK